MKIRYTKNWVLQWRKNKKCPRARCHICHEQPYNKAMNKLKGMKKQQQKEIQRELSDVMYYECIRKGSCNYVYKRRFIPID